MTDYHGIVPQTVTFHIPDDAFRATGPCRSERPAGVWHWVVVAAAVTSKATGIAEAGCGKTKVTRHEMSCGGVNVTTRLQGRLHSVGITYQ